MSLQQLLEHSRRYGKDPSYVLLGGGNTSLKEDGVLYVKASGHALGTIGSEGFVRMDLGKLQNIWDKEYSSDDDEREDQVLSDMMDCRLKGEQARPSVEALLHALLPFRYVVHLHPALVNGITCAQNGEEAVQQLFPQALWIDLVKPGFILANVVRVRLEEQRQASNPVPSLIFLQNHGIFVGSDTLEQIDQEYRFVMQKIEGQLKRKPDFSDLEADRQKVSQIKEALSRYTQSEVLFSLNKEYSGYLADAAAFAPVSSSFTPDHIVYAGFKPLFVEQEADVVQAFKAFEKTYAVMPKIVCVQGLGVFSMGEKPMPLFLDSVAISVYSESFGGPRFMDEAMIDFIRNWEVEKYRSSVVSK